MRCCWAEFAQVCKQVERGLLTDSAGGKLKTHFQAAEMDTAGIWRALDADCSGWISLREFDPGTHIAIAEFKRWADRHHKGAIEAFHKIDGNGNGKVYKWELMKGTRFPEPYRGDVEVLFESLDLSDAGFLTESEFKFLDQWDLELEDLESDFARMLRPSRRMQAIANP
mmetsp:Transcript_96978/g.274275  ORF Transcript_96978/g.274275 Transcript_96978/m.274275 type:complete len:169 (+) Transcript_96978:2-508(+)